MRRAAQKLSQQDDDGDGVANEVDQCPNTPAGESVDAQGCAESERDNDGDGVANDVDQCPNTPAGESVGCSWAAPSLNGTTTAMALRTMPTSARIRRQESR